jgi:hypothetical protein
MVYTSVAFDRTAAIVRPRLDDSGGQGVATAQDQNPLIVMREQCHLLRIVSIDAREQCYGPPR